MPAYSFQLSSHLAGRAVSVVAAGSSTAVASGTLDSSSRFVADLAVGDYVAAASDGKYAYQAAGTVDQGDPDRLVDLGSTYAPKVSMIVDAAGKGDYTTISAAMLAVPAGGADVLVKRGTYTTTNGILIPSNTTLRGEGEGTVIVLANGANKNTISTASSSSNITIRDLKVDGNKAHNTLASGSTIVVNGSTTTVVGCHVVNSAGYGIVSYGYGTSNGNDVLFLNNIVEDCAKEGLEFQGTSRSSIVGNLVRNSGYNGIYVWGATSFAGTCRDITVSGNTVSGHGATTTATGIRVDDGAANVTVTGNTVNNAGTAGSYGISAAAAGATPTLANITISGNTVSGANLAAGIFVSRAADVTVNGNAVKGTNVGINIASDASVVTIGSNMVANTSNNGIYVSGPDSAVTGNNVDTCGGTTNDGLKIFSTSGVTVTGNRVKSSGAAGILLSAVSDFTATGNACHANRTSGVYVLDGNNGVVSGNVCRANGRQGVGSVTSNGITLFKNAATCSGVIVSGNRCYDDQGTKTQAYGVRVYGAATDCVLGPNLSSGNATGAQLVDAAATTITNVTPA